MLGFILLAYFSNQQNHKIKVIIYIALALLFRPFIKVALGRMVGNVLDVIVSAGLIISLFVKHRKA
jgi:urea transporter